MPLDLLVRLLARCLLAGEQTVEGVVARCARMLGRDWRGLRPLARNYLAAWRGRTRPRLEAVVDFIYADPGFQRAWERHHRGLTEWHLPVDPAQMQPVAAAAVWAVPRIETARALADWFWLAVCG